jgi:hypothetical protein
MARARWVSCMLLGLVLGLSLCLLVLPAGYLGNDSS